MNADVAQMDAERIGLNTISHGIIGAAQKVSSTLGYGFLEKVYENALRKELLDRRLKVEQQLPIQVFYQGEVVGDYIPDLLVEGSVIVEIKAVTGLDRVHRQQCLNYLRAAGLHLGLVLNFGRAHLEARVVSNF